MSTGLAYHVGTLEHIPYSTNPDIPERVKNSYEHLGKVGLLDELALLSPEPASEEDLLRVHNQRHIDYVTRLSETGYEENDVINTDVYVCPCTCEAAHLAAGAVKLAAEKVLWKEVDNAFALVRPPGHHAGPQMPAGFCYFNSTAIAIRYLQQVLGVDKVAVFDWDAHCGNGTMEIFYSDPGVLTISVHQDPRSFYPGTGFAEQRGEGEGEGFCVNLPVPAGTGDIDYMHLLDEYVLERMREFQPEIIFVAAGQDSHVSDHISGLKVTDLGYAWMTRKLMNLADEVCEGRLTLVLEGGYNIDTMPKTIEKIIRTLMGAKMPQPIEGQILDSTEEIVGKFRDYTISL